MLFNSAEYFLFLPITFILYWFAFKSSLRKQNILLLIASYFFYAWWSRSFLLLLFLSTLLDYIYGFFVASINRKKAKLFLWLSIVNNIGILAVFKYYNFFALQFQQGFQLLGFHTHPALLHFILPIGISFYTFHGLSYIFDIYRGKQKPVTNLVDYALFVSFFPLLVAGPIERATHLLPQIQKKRLFSYKQSVEGCRLILWGLFKKVVIADSLATIADEIFANYHQHNAITLILGAIAFTFQIYGDFSGYSDIAIGTAKLLGFEVLSNFRFPYFSRDIAEFWRRWHISLTSWFRDYLYIPLGGSRNGKWKNILNVFIIFLISAFWHGASWNFIAWGCIHACAFLPLLLLKKNRVHVIDTVAENKMLPNLKELAQMIGTFTFVTVAWIFFRIHIADSVDYLIQIFVGLYNNPRQLFSIPKGASVFIYIIPFVCFDWWLRGDERILKRPPFAMFLYSVMTLTVLYFLFSKDESSAFIYYRF